MGFWQAFRDGYQSVRGAEREPEFSEAEPRPPPPHDADAREECRRLGAMVRELEGRLAEHRSLIDELTRENQRLVAELETAKAARRPREDAKDREERERLAAALREREQQLAESKELIAELAAEMEKLSAELKVRRRAEPQGKGDEKYKKLRRAVIKHVHPDKAGGDKGLAATLERICKDLNAEIDRIDAS